MSGGWTSGIASTRWNTVTGRTISSSMTLPTVRCWSGSSEWFSHTRATTLLTNSAIYESCGRLWCVTRARPFIILPDQDGTIVVQRYGNVGSLFEGLAKVSGMDSIRFLVVVKLAVERDNEFLARSQALFQLRRIQPLISLFDDLERTDVSATLQHNLCGPGLTLFVGDSPSDQCSLLRRPSRQHCGADAGLGSVAGSCDCLSKKQALQVPHSCCAQARDCDPSARRSPSLGTNKSPSENSTVVANERPD